MNKILIVFFTLLLFSCSQSRYLPKVLKGVAEAPRIVYYPFYDDIQMVEIDYLPQWIKGRNAAISKFSKLPPMGSQPIFFYSPMPQNTFIFRDRQGTIIAQYNVRDSTELNLIQTSGTTIQVKTIFHKQRPRYTEPRPPNYSIPPPIIKSKTSLFRYYISSEKGFGIIDTLGKVLIQPIYSNIGLIDSQYYLTKENKVELTDIDFNTILPAKYEQLEYFDKGLYLIMKDRRYGFIDIKGNEIIRPQYKYKPYPFVNGFAKVYEDKWGLIDSLGKEVCQPIYDIIHDFKDGLAMVARDKKWGFINKKGEEIIECTYEMVNYFHDGIVWVKKDKWGLIDTIENEICPPIYDRMLDYKEGFAAVLRDKKWGFVNKEGIETIECMYEMAGFFIDGMAKIKMGKWGFINTTGMLKIKPIYSFIAYPAFHNNLCIVCNDTTFQDKNNKHRRSRICGIVNIEGEIIIPLQYQQLSTFSEGLCAACKEDYQKKEMTCGYIDKNNNIIIPFEYKNLGKAFKNGQVFVSRTNGKGTYIDKSGKELKSKN